MDAEYIQQLNTLISDIVRKCTCEVCNRPNFTAIRSYPFPRPCNHAHGSFLNLSDLELVQVWKSVWNIPGEVETALKCIIDSYTNYGIVIPTPEMCIAHAHMIMRINTLLPQIHGKSVFRKMITHRTISAAEWILISYQLTIAPTLDVLALVDRVEAGRLAGMEMEELWIMESYEHSKYIQWLPREILEDVEHLLIPTI